MDKLRFSLFSEQNISAEVAYLHDDKKLNNTAYEKTESVEILLSVPRSIGATDAYITIYDESLTHIIEEMHGEWCGAALGMDEYIFTPDIADMGCGLYFMRPRLQTLCATLYGILDGAKLIFSPSECGQMLQLTVSDFKHAPPNSLYGGIIYHIFVDRFNRGGDAVIPPYMQLVSGEWDTIPEYPEYPGAPLKNNTVYGGTLWGIADKLDYISSLGVNAIYLSPIFDSVSNHKYDTADYMKVDSAFGSDAALSHLISECDTRGIKVILDGVFNHTGDDSVYFNRRARFDTIGAYQSNDSPYYSWYDFQNHPNKYTCWWGIDILPRINPDNSDCGEFFVGDGGVIEKYSDMGIYGMRLDVADELSDSFIEKIKNILSRNGESVLYGEVWEDASNKIAYDKRKKYYLGSELDGVMNYPVRVGLIDFICNRSTDSLRYALEVVFANAPSRIMHAEMNLLGTHDTERILTVLGGKSSDGYSNAELSLVRMTASERELATTRLMAAYTVLATLPGIPAIFYGDEAGLEGYHDPFNRMPYPWGREDSKLLEHYRLIGNIRRKNAVYMTGDFKLLHLDEELLVFSRSENGVAFVTLFNNSDDIIDAWFDKSVHSLTDKVNDTHHTLYSMTSKIIKTKNNNVLSFSKREVL